jgi:hypothetical protein
MKSLGAYVMPYVMRNEYFSHFVEESIAEDYCTHIPSPRLIVISSLCARALRTSAVLG